MKKLIFCLLALLAVAGAEARWPKGMPTGVVSGGGGGGGTGTWVNVTPTGVNLTAGYGGACNSFGTETVFVDSAHPSNVYFHAHCQGIWKSTDYGQTWVGPINTGTNGSTIADCAGGITGAANGATPVIYEACIRGAGYGLNKSTDGGVNWSILTVVPPLPSGRPDGYPPTIDPYNVNHVLLSGHEQNYLIQSTDGGATWSSVTLNAGMLENGGTAFAFFINTGNSGTTANTWLWIDQQIGGTYGTWRTTNGGTSWAKVDNNEHPHGASQIYQPDTSGVVYMAGAYSSAGWGVLRSADYGATWAHVGSGSNETVVWGTPNRVYSMYGWSDSNPVQPAFQSAPQPGTSWASATGAPTSFTGGPHQIAVTNDGTHYIFIGAMGLSGVWRYIE